MYNKNQIGPKLYPCVTPDLVTYLNNYTPIYSTYYSLSPNNDCKKSTMRPETPNLLNLESLTQWFILSKAFVKSVLNKDYINWFLLCKTLDVI